MTAPAAMPGEEVEHAWNSIADEHNQWSELGQDEKDSLAQFAAALLVPILAEKERETRERCAAIAEDACATPPADFAGMELNAFHCGADAMNEAIAAAIRAGE